jgi:hypothetical protein
MASFPIPPISIPLIIDPFDGTKIAAPKPKPQLEVRVGQVWKNARFGGTACQIIEKVDEGFRMVITESSSDVVGRQLGMRYIITTDLLNKHWTLYRDDYLAGADCSKCKRHYPHANGYEGFICWGCQRGY